VIVLKMEFWNCILNSIYYNYLEIKYPIMVCCSV